MFKISFKLLLYLFSLFIFLEVLSFCILKFKDQATFPNYQYGKSTHYLDINNTFGTWHIPNSSFRHIKNCYNVRYDFNSIGARDDEFENNDINSIFAIGDSYLEGYGLNKEDLITNKIEKIINQNILNFGTSGYFGTTNARLLYDYYGKNYKHSLILHVVSIPSDFEDDNYGLNKTLKTTQNRYRPYLINHKGNYIIEYSNKNLNLDNNKKINLKDLLGSYTNFYHLLRLLKSYYNYSKISKEPKKNLKKTTNHYEDYNPEVLKIMKENFLHIKEESLKNNAKYMIILLPDYNTVVSNLDKVETKLSSQLSSYSKMHNIYFLDTMKKIKSNKIDINKLYYTNEKDYDCDSHITPYGSNMYSEIISNFLLKIN